MNEHWAVDACINFNCGMCVFIEVKFSSFVWMNDDDLLTSLHSTHFNSPPSSSSNLRYRYIRPCILHCTLSVSPTQNGDHFEAVAIILILKARRPPERSVRTWFGDENSSQSQNLPKLRNHHRTHRTPPPHRISRHRGLPIGNNYH